MMGVTLAVPKALSGLTLPVPCLYLYAAWHEGVPAVVEAGVCCHKGMD